MPSTRSSARRRRCTASPAAPSDRSACSCRTCSSRSPNVTVTASARLDRWRNYDAHNTETTLSTGAVSDPVLADKKDSVVSPRLGALYRVHERLSVWGDIASGFRAPTLNELYRRFSHGAVVTLANPALGPERLVGGELGVNVIPRAASPGARRGSTIASRIRSRTSRLHRQTCCSGRTSGAHASGASRPTSTTASAGRCVSAAPISTTSRKWSRKPANPALVGLRLAQVPTHRGAFQLPYSDPRFVTIAFDPQVSGAQFDDDLNTSLACAAQVLARQSERVARYRTQPRGIRCRSEHVRQGVFRRLAPHARRTATPGQRRRQGQLPGALTRGALPSRPGWPGSCCRRCGRLRVWRPRSNTAPCSRALR